MAQVYDPGMVVILRIVPSCNTEAALPILKPPGESCQLKLSNNTGFCNVPVQYHGLAGLDKMTCALSADTTKRGILHG